MTQQYGAGGGISVTLAGPFGGSGTGSRLTELTLSAAGWKGAISPYSQQVSVEGISVNSRVDLLPGPALLGMLRCILTAENDTGTVTVYALGEKPQQDITLQAALTEVVA